MRWGSPARAHARRRQVAPHTSAPKRLVTRVARSAAHPLCSTAVDDDRGDTNRQGDRNYRSRDVPHEERSYPSWATAFMQGRSVEGRFGVVAHEGQEIDNPRTGQRMTFVELRDDLLRVDSVNPPTSQREPVHVHPKQESGADVLAGTLVFEVAGEQRRIGPGETIRIPPNTPHRFWNDGSEDARSIQFFRPALDIAAFFETMFTLAQRDELDAKGMPRPLQLAVMVPEFGNEIRPTSPPWPVLKALTAILAPVARRRGYRARPAA
jgi:quercetin dioxygenase-like cupin family protein